jgi:hypothetical protein
MLRYRILDAARPDILRASWTQFGDITGATQISGKKKPLIRVAFF